MKTRRRAKRFVPVLFVILVCNFFSGCNQSSDGLKLQVESISHVFRDQTADLYVTYAYLNHPSIDGIIEETVYGVNEFPERVSLYKISGEQKEEIAVWTKNPPLYPTSYKYNSTTLFWLDSSGHIYAYDLESGICEKIKGIEDAIAFEVTDSSIAFNYKTQNRFSVYDIASGQLYDVAEDFGMATPYWIPQFYGDDQLLFFNNETHELSFYSYKDGGITARYYAADVSMFLSAIANEKWIIFMDINHMDTQPNIHYNAPNIHIMNRETQEIQKADGLSNYMNFLTQDDLLYLDVSGYARVMNLRSMESEPIQELEGKEFGRIRKTVNGDSYLMDHFAENTCVVRAR